MRYIPKVIHLIWFGGNPYNYVIQRCIDSWKKFCPDYEIKIWNEESFDVTANIFVNEAYNVKKWAFVSDYVRLYVLYHFGGVYIDSDVEVLKPFDELLENEHVVTGYSTSGWIPAGFMAAEKGNIWIKELLDYYAERHFVKEDGSYDMKPNNAIITDLSKQKNGFKPGDTFIPFGNVRLYPKVYFQPFKKQIFEFNEKNLNQLKKFYAMSDIETYCIHHSVGSWGANKRTFLSELKHIIRFILPQRIVEYMEVEFYKRKYK